MKLKPDLNKSTISHLNATDAVQVAELLHG